MSAHTDVLCCRWGYRGVIIGWDETARAPAHWLAEMHRGQPGWGHQPNYAVLVDTRDRPAPQITYVPQVTPDQAIAGTDIHNTI